MIDKHLLHQRFAAAKASYNQHAVVQKEMAQRLCALAQKHLPSAQERLLEIGCGTGLLTQEVMQHFHVCEYFGNDLVESIQEDIRKIAEGKTQRFAFIGGDVEKARIPTELSSVWSGATMQWMTDLPRFFQQLHSALRPSGMLVLSSFGGENFREIKHCSNKGIDYPSFPEIQAMTTGLFQLIEFEEWQEQLCFDNPQEVLRHMQHTGVNGLTRQAWTPPMHRQFVAKYQALKTEKGFPITYHPYLMIFQKK